MKQKNLKHSTHRNHRDDMTERFLKALEENPRQWHQQWSVGETGRPYNYYSKKPYNGINSFNLKLAEIANGYNDARWVTFKQASERGWKVQKGAKGEKVEFWFPFDAENRKWLTWDEYNNLSEEEKTATFVDAYGKEREKYSEKVKIFTLFNASVVEGIPKLVMEKRDINPSEVVDKIAKGLEVKMNNDGGDQAFYRPATDSIHLPEIGFFKSDAGYCATALHELAHSTGSAKRLDRDLSGNFGSESYAYEELIAEITSSFMGEYVEATMTEEIIENHLAYVQNWVEAIKDNKKYLFDAIKEAQKASDYMVEKGELSKLYEEVIVPQYKIVKAQLKTNELISQEAINLIDEENFKTVKSFENLPDATEFFNFCQMEYNERTDSFDVYKITYSQYDEEGDLLSEEDMETSKIPIELDLDRTITIEKNQEGFTIILSNENEKKKIDVHQTDKFYDIEVQMESYRYLGEVFSSQEKDKIEIALEKEAAAAKELKAYAAGNKLNFERFMPKKIEKGEEI